MESVVNCISRLNGIDVEGNLASGIGERCIETKCKDYQAFVVCVGGGGGGQPHLDVHTYTYHCIFRAGGGGGGV